MKTLLEKLQPGTLREDRPVASVIRLNLTSPFTRSAGFVSSAYVLDDLLIDTGHSYVRAELLEYFRHHPPLQAIACTHHHEDHTGNAGPLAEQNDCPVYLHNSDRRHTEGVEHLPFYRQLSWGPAAPYSPQELPETLQTSTRRLAVIPTPGHSTTHACFYEADTGIVFTGDLYVTGGATAIMDTENPYDSIRSLRRVADLEPHWLLNGHGLVLERPAEALRKKADRIEATAAEVRRLHATGLPTRRIQSEVFINSKLTDLFWAGFSGGEFCRTNFIQACIALAHQAET